MTTQRNGGLAAWAIGVLLIITFATVAFGVGLELASNPTGIASIVTQKATPLLLLEIYKIVQAVATIILVGAIYRLWAPNPPSAIRNGTIAGVVSALFLMVAGIAGLVAISVALQATGGGATSTGDAVTYLTINAIVNGLGRIALFVSGLWILVLSVVSLQRPFLPRALAYLGVALGILSFVSAIFPLFGLLVLILAIIWHFWIGALLVNSRLKL